MHTPMAHWEVGNTPPRNGNGNRDLNSLFGCPMVAATNALALVGLATIAAKITRAARRTVRG